MLSGLVESGLRLTYSYEVYCVRTSVIGKTLRDFLRQKNINARYCQDWLGVTNFAVQFSGWNTVLAAVTLNSKKVREHISRFTSSLDNGVVTFIGSSSAEIPTIYL